jgi:hypothetical protein
MITKNQSNEGVLMTKKVSSKQEERFIFIDFCANYLGTIGRVDIVNRFGISDAAASKDIAEYIERAPKNLSYNFKTKTHIPTKKFKSLYQFSATQVLKTLSTGLINTQMDTFTPLLQSENSLELSKPEGNIIAQISRAIHLKKIVEITYWSLSSGETERKLAPFAIIDSGLRWHLRAFCRRRNIFCDFVFTRILKANLTEEDVKENESQSFDKDWNRMINLELVPHPKNVKQPKSIILDYGMVNDLLELEVRFAVAGYVLRLWNIDCTPDHSLKDRNYQLWLRNGNSIVELNSLVMAPGIEKWTKAKPES